jgi:hypothetical protein
MANLVSPGYDRSSLIHSTLAPIEERIIEFKGLNRRTVIEEGEMSDMRNLTPDMYPVLKPRKPRGHMELSPEIMRPIHLIRRFDKLAMIAIDMPEQETDPTTVSFWYDGVKIPEVNNLTVHSYAVAINNRMCFFNCTGTSKGYALDITVDGVQEGTYKPLDVDITATNLIVNLSDTETTFEYQNTHGLNYDDAIDIKLTSYTPSGGGQVTTDKIISCIVEEVRKDTPSAGTDTIVLPAETFIELSSTGVTSLTINGHIKRTMPELDLIVEWNNRLWGCNNSENMIYASKLGDPFNWHYFQGTGLDSYYAQQGSDEKFTAIAEYSGHILFFKPNSITRVYGTAPSNYQVTTTKAYGVEPGSGKSVLTINDTVYYKSAIGIMAYQGGVPVSISDKLAGAKIFNVVAGTEGTKYYASCLTKKNGKTEGVLLVYDIDLGMWHKEDGFRFLDSCKIEDKIYCIFTSADILLCAADIYCNEDLMVGTEAIEGEVAIINPDIVLRTHAEAEAIDPDDPPENYEDLAWMAVFGPFDEWLEEHKIYSKLALRLIADGEAAAKVYISINEGDWELVENYEEVSTKGDFIPIIPRRCDRYAVKVEGTGNVEMKTLTRRVRRGSFGRL